MRLPRLLDCGPHPATNEVRAIGSEILTQAALVAAKVFHGDVESHWCLARLARYSDQDSAFGSLSDKDIKMLFGLGL
jgi:hypothetical protein